MGIEWSGTGVGEEGVNTESGGVIVSVDPRYFRPTEVDTLLGDPSDAQKAVLRTGKRNDCCRSCVCETLRFSEGSTVPNA